MSEIFILHIPLNSFIGVASIVRGGRFGEHTGVEFSIKRFVCTHFDEFSDS